MAADSAMDFEIDSRESFADWFLRVKPRLQALAARVGRASRTEAAKGMQEDLVAHIDALLEDLSDVSLEVAEHSIKAREYFESWLADATAAELALKWTDKKKTALDFCKAIDSQQKRVLSRLEAMRETIEMRRSVCQSMLKTLKP